MQPIVSAPRRPKELLYTRSRSRRLARIAPHGTHEERPAGAAPVHGHATRPTAAAAPPAPAASGLRDVPVAAPGPGLDLLRLHDGGRPGDPAPRPDQALPREVERGHLRRGRPHGAGDPALRREPEAGDVRPGR